MLAAVGFTPFNFGPPRVKKGRVTHVIVMRTLVRRIGGSTYFQDPDHWTPNPDKGREFKSMTEAVEFVEHGGYRNMEVAFLYDNPRRLSSVRVDTLEGLEA